MATSVIAIYTTGSQLLPAAQRDNKQDTTFDTYVSLLYALYAGVEQAASFRTKTRLKHNIT